jgi:hypothetical protein
VDWTAINSGLTATDVWSVTIDPSAPATIYAGTGGGAFKSINGGATWQPTGANSGNGTPPATTISKVSGDNQTGNTSHPLRYPFVAVVTNASGALVEGVTVNFAVTSGGGTLSGTQSTADSQGMAFTTLILGPTPGTNSVTATATGLGGPLIFTTGGPRAPPPLINAGGVVSVDATASTIQPGEWPARNLVQVWIIINQQVR